MNFFTNLSIPKMMSFIIETPIEVKALDNEHFIVFLEFIHKTLIWVYDASFLRE